MLSDCLYKKTKPVGDTDCKGRCNFRTDKCRGADVHMAHQLQFSQTKRCRSQLEHSREYNCNVRFLIFFVIVFYKRL